MKKVKILIILAISLFIGAPNTGGAEESPVRVNNNLLGATETLDRNIILSEVNGRRTDNGLPALSENSLLDVSSATKARDMINKNYFGHDSPDGNGVEYFGDAAGYDFILMGENLAYGDFKDEEALVEAWMESESHRANMLNPKFHEIGLGIERGYIKGRNTWVIVTHFGLPASACPKVQSSLKVAIEGNTKKIDKLMKKLRLGEGRLAEVISFIRFYKSVSEYNSILKETKALVDSYNTSVGRFNDCVAKNS